MDDVLCSQRGQKGHCRREGAGDRGEQGRVAGVRAEDKDQDVKNRGRRKQDEKWGKVQREREMEGCWEVWMQEEY